MRPIIESKKLALKKELYALEKELIESDAYLRGLQKQLSGLGCKAF